MERYKYKVDYLDAKVTASDVSKGSAGQKIANQVEIKLREWADKGFEYYSQGMVDVSVHPGCSALFGQKTESINVMVLVFRKPLR
jgi:hypothetical protein